MAISSRTEFLNHLFRAFSDQTLIRLSLGKYRGDDDLKRIKVSPVSIKNKRCLSFVFHYLKQDISKNYEIDSAVKEIDKLLGNDFLSATLFTSTNDYVLEFSRKKRDRLFIKPPTLTKLEESHNKEKKRYVSEDSPYLESLGIASNGRIKPQMYDKYRQINKYIEIIESLLKVCPLRKQNSVEAIDFGSGKSYLTFALYDYLSKRFASARVKGIELRKDLVELSNIVAREAGFSSLEFKEGEISGVKAERADLVVALHACDTATDDAISYALSCKASIIVVAPCCQKYLRPKLFLPEILKPVFSHGILEARLADSLTDGFRALWLKAQGYDTKVFEFISPEHTAKNIMITAVRKEMREIPDKTALNQLSSLKTYFGLSDIYLDRT